MSSLLGFLGIILIFLPFLIFKNHGFLTLIMLCIGFVLIGLAKGIICTIWLKKNLQVMS
jgi:hypothetical protein